MRIRIYLIFFLFCTTAIKLQALYAQTLYYPDSTWEARRPGDLKMNGQMLDSAVHFAIRNETTTDYDLRTANLKAYAHEPNYKILGPIKRRGKPAGIILRNGYIVAQWGDVK